MTSFNIVPGEKLVLPRRRLVHKPVEKRNLSKKLQGTVDTSRGDEYVWELKYDGCHMILIKLDDGVCGAWSREGEPVRSVQHILDEFDETYPAATVVFSEAWDFERTHHEISGDFRRHSNSPRLMAMQFDVITLEDFIQGKSRTEYRLRRQLLEAGTHLYITKSFVPDRLAVEMDAVHAARKNGVAFALDGCIAARRDGMWIAGDGKGGEKIKEKNHISVELRVIAWKEGEGKFAGMLGALLCEDLAGEEHPISCGTMTTEERKALWDVRCTDLTDRICEVHALSYTESGALREPRFIRWRDDKTEID